MRTKTLGNAFLVFGFLLSAAGIAVPSSGLSAAATVLVFAGFFIVTANSHQDWGAGYRAAQLDMRFESESVPSKPWDGGPVEADGPLYKCGFPDCHCVTDVRYREWTA